MRPLLLIMLIFIFVSSFFAGTWMMIDYTGIRAGLERSMLAPTPFKDFFVPGALMILLISLPSMMAALFLITRKAQAASHGILSGALITAWIIMQLILIPGYMGLSVLYLVLGILILLISLQLRGKMAV